MPAPSGWETAGRVGEQIGEFMVPGGAEEAVGSAVPKALAPAARIATSALTSGGVNKAQGGSFGTGAVLGAAGGALGEGARAIAPKIAEKAIGIRKADRFYDKTPGAAIINETRGFSPATVADSARDAIDKLSSQAEGLYSGSPTPVSLQPARDVFQKAISKAEAENNPAAIEQLKKLGSQLDTNYTTKLPLAPTQTANGLRNLKRGFGDAVGTWNPEISKGVNNVGKQAYRALDSELDRAVPEGADLNQRISSLIPVAKRAESTAHNAGTVQRVLSRVGAHTGALTGLATGSYGGYKEGGVPGAVVGGLTGLVVPELVASPTGQMTVARTLASPVTRGLMRSSTVAPLPLTRNPNAPKGALLRQMVPSLPR